MVPTATFHLNVGQQLPFYRGNNKNDSEGVLLLLPPLQKLDPNIRLENIRVKRGVYGSSLQERSWPAGVPIQALELLKAIDDIYVNTTYNFFS